ncbi:MAG: hypothetical protein WCF30_20830 [Terracidiphilus sp.]
MNIQDIVVEIDAEISNLQQVMALLQQCLLRGEESLPGAPAGS